MDDLDGIQASLRAESSETRERLVREIGSFTVALLAVSGSGANEILRLAGTGTLVIVGGSHYILTAAHVWQEILWSARQIGITLKENEDHRFLMDANTIVPYGLQMAATWNEWGPDVILLLIPPGYLGSIYAHRVFYNLSIARETKLDLDHIETRVLMGTPKESGQFTETHADLQINGLFMEDSNLQTHEDLDYLDFDVDVSTTGVPNTSAA